MKKLLLGLIFISIAASCGSNTLYKISNSGTVLEMTQYYGDIPPDMETIMFTSIYYRQEELPHISFASS